MLGFVQDVTQIMEARSHKDNAKEYDMLTGMYTRDYFIRRVRSMLSEIAVLPSAVWRRYTSTA